MTGLLQQLPDLGQLSQTRDLIQGGLGDLLHQVADDPSSLVAPIMDVLGDLGDQLPDITGMLAPLTEQRQQLSAALPTGIDQSIAAVLPLLGSVDEALDSSALAAIVDDLRAGRPLNDIARDGLRLAIDQLLGQLPAMTGGAIAGDKLAAIESLLAASSTTTPDPDVLARFLAEHVLGVPIAALSAVTDVRERFFGALSQLQQTAGSALDGLEQTLAQQLSASAQQLAALDPARAADWQAAQTTIQSARTALDSLYSALRIVPGGVFNNIGQLNGERFKAELRQALQALPTSDDGVSDNRLASLEGLANDILEPLDQMIAALAAAGPGEVSQRLRTTLDSLLSLFDVLAESVQDNPVFDFFDDLQQLVAQVTTAIQSVETTIDGALSQIIAVVATIAQEFTAIRQQVEAAFQTLGTAIDQLDLAGLSQAITAIFEQIDSALAAIPLEAFKQSLDTALTTVEQLVTTLSEATTGTLAQLETLIGTLDQIQFAPVAEPVIAAIQAIKDVLAAIDPNLLPEILQQALHEAIDAFEVQFNGDFQGYFQSEIVDQLNTAFQSATESIQNIVTQIQQKLREFATAVGQFDPSLLLAPVTNVFNELRDTLADVSGEQVLAPIRALLNDLLAALEAIAPERLLAPLEQAFEQDVLGPIQRFKPSDLLQPLITAFAPLEALIDQLDFSQTFASLGTAAGEFFGTTHGELVGALDFSHVPGVGGVSAQVTPVLNLLQPTTSMDDWTAALDEILSNYRPSMLIEPIQIALAPVETMLLNASDELLLAIFGQLHKLSAAANLLHPATSSTVTAQLGQIATALERIQPPTIGDRLRPIYASLRSAFNGITAASVPASLQPQYAAVAAAVAALDPQAVLEPLNSTLAPLPAHIRQLAGRPLDLDDLRVAFEARLGALVGLLPGFLADELTPATIREGLVVFSPTTLIQRIDERFDAFLHAAERFAPAIQATAERFVDELGAKLSELSPAAAFERFDAVFQPIRTAVTAISPQAIADRLDHTYGDLLAQLSAVHPRMIREAAQDLFETVRTKLQSLQQQLIEPIITGIDAVLGRIRTTLAALDPQELIISLGNLFALIQQALESIQLEAPLQHLKQALERLRNELSQVLQRATAAFQQMVEAIPV